MSKVDSTAPDGSAGLTQVVHCALARTAATTHRIVQKRMILSLRTGALAGYTPLSSRRGVLLDVLHHPERVLPDETPDGPGAVGRADDLAT